MSNSVITNCDTGSFEVSGGIFEDDLLTFAGAGTVKAGTILARDSVSLKLVPFVKGGSTNENGIPKAIVTYPVVATGAGNLPVRVMVGGVGSLARAVIHSDGTNANIDKKVIDTVREFAKINLLKEKELNILDNQ